MGVGSGRARAEAAEHRLSCTAAQALLKAARGPTLSSPHAGCTLGACMLGGLNHAYSTPSARISRPLVTPWPPCGTRSDRRSRDLLVSAVDRSEKIKTYTCVPYEWNWSQDVEKCTLDLVLSSFTHTNAVQAIAVASKGCWFFLQDPLRLGWMVAVAPLALPSVTAFVRHAARIVDLRAPQLLS